MRRKPCFRLCLPLLALSLTSCASDPSYTSTGSWRADIHNMGQSRICQYIADFATSFAWTNQRKGIPVENVVAAFDDYLATHPSFQQRDARQVNRAIYVVYANPQWDQGQAYTGVEQDCRRSSMY